MKQLILGCAALISEEEAAHMHLEETAKSHGLEAHEISFLIQKTCSDGHGTVMADLKRFLSTAKLVYADELLEHTKRHEAHQRFNLKMAMARLGLSDNPLQNKLKEVLEAMEKWTPADSQLMSQLSLDSKIRFKRHFSFTRRQWGYQLRFRKTSMWEFLDEQDDSMLRLYLRIA